MVMKKSSLALFLFSFLLIISINTTAQFVPVSVSGFNQDVIAESGNSSLTTTTIAMDGVPASNNVMYTVGFGNNNSFGGGGIPDNGVITDPSGTYQMPDYSFNNALVIPRNQNGDLTLNTPSSFSKIRILCLSTEGPSLVNAKLFFTDGTITNALSNANLNDWFTTTGNIVLSGFGRCNRVTPVTSASAFPINPAMFYLEISLSCADAQKTLQKINFSNVTTAGTNAPFPNAIFFAVSGKTNSKTITPTITDASCQTGGIATLSITGTASPYTVSWNTNPPQLGLTASNLTAGTYTATITDANSCISTYNASIILNNNLTILTNSNSSICNGDSIVANTISNATVYNWSPSVGVSNTNIATPTLSPTTTTTYTLNASLGTCNTTRFFTVTVVSPNLGIRLDTSICTGNNFIPNITGNTSTFIWYPTTGVSDPNIANPVLSPTNTTTYTVTGTLDVCTFSRTFTVYLYPVVLVDAGNPVAIASGTTTQLQGVGTSGNYLWTPTASLSAASILNPIASPSTTTQYVLTITTDAGCKNSDSVLVTVVPECVKQYNAFSPNGDGINENWIVTDDHCTSSVNAFVYNRYGTKVFESKDYHNNWYGTFMGKPVPDGTYYYVLNITDINGKKITLRGDLTIVR
jgi:gliding motility-associated-like protein